ncbi:MAG: Mut7-C ubiquitin/RNAse domain-containing protein [Candidatus Omnitrophica bacterium]|nr:Mut7-C ubiquitin/RNAse domain-containing protein [Candidatus Omnitrophota bacterium]
MATRVKFFFQASLRDFLKPKRRKMPVQVVLQGSPAVRDTIESLGVPHTEVRRVIVHSKRVPLAYRLQDKDVVSVWPVRFVSIRRPKFILDVHLGKLARYLRLCGFDTVYQNDFTDKEIIRLATKMRGLVLTRDLGLLKHKTLKLGYWLRSTAPKEQLREVLKKFFLHSRIRPFRICLECNERLRSVIKKDIVSKIPPRTRRYFNVFRECPQCHRIYWKGSHYERMRELLTDLRILKSKHAEPARCRSF